MLTLQGHSGPVQSLAFAANGRTLASCGLDKTVKLWDVATGQERVTLHHEAAVFCVAVSPNGRLLASGSLDEIVKLWDLSTGRELGTLDGHGCFVTSLAFSPDGGTLASASGDRVDFNNRGEVIFWDLATRRQRAELTSERLSHILQTRWEGYYTVGGIWALTYSRNGSTLALGTGSHAAILWDVAEDRERLLIEQAAGVRALVLAPDGRQLATASGWRICLWDAVTGKERALLDGHRGTIWSLAYSPDGHTLASGSSDGTVALWDIHARRQHSAFNWQIGKIHAVAFGPDGMTAAAAGERGSVVVWDVDERGVVRRWAVMVPCDCISHLSSYNSAEFPDAITE